MLPAHAQPALQIGRLLPRIKPASLYFSVKFINERGAPMPNMALSTIDIDIPDEVLSLLGEPPVLTEKECVAFERILERFAQVVRPRDIVEWFFVWDLTVCRATIQRLQRL